MLAISLKIIFLDIGAVNKDFTFSRVVQAEQELYYGRLSGSVMTDQSTNLVTLDLKRKVLNDGLILLVLKRDISELDAFNLLGGKVSVEGLLKDSVQGDRVYKKYFNMLLSVEHPVIDISDCPDLGPILMALLAARKGGTLTGTKRLKIKERDRASAMSDELKKFGIEAKVFENSVEIREGTLKAPGKDLCGHNDHRIVMALSTLLSVTGGWIEGAEAVKKSYPDYFEVIKKLGIKVSENGMD